jgi:hypothetical protein
VLMVVENAPTNHRGLLGSMVQIGNPIGVLAAVAIFSLVSKLPDVLGLAHTIPDQHLSGRHRFVRPPEPR